MVQKREQSIERGRSTDSYRKWFGRSNVDLSLSNTAGLLANRAFELLISFYLGTFLRKRLKMKHGLVLVPSFFL